MQIPIRVFLITALLLAVALNVSAQTASTNTRSYEATLYLVVGSSANSARSELPKPLEPIGRQLRERFRLGEMRLASVHFARLGDDGSLDQKGIAAISGAEAPTLNRAYLEWQIRKLRAAYGGTDHLRLELFRLGAKVPVTNQVSKESVPVFSYEDLGLRLTELTMDVNEPTLLGTLTLPGSEGTVFVLMAVKPV